MARTEGLMPISEIVGKWREQRALWRAEHPNDVPGKDDVREDCPGCGGDGWRLGGGGGAEPCPLCRPPKRRLRLEDYIVLDKPREVHEQMVKAVLASRAVIDLGTPPWLVLVGPNGNGKTMLASIILAARQKLGESGQAWRSEELLGWFRETQGGLDNLPPEERQTLGVRQDHIRRLKWLVLDELGKERHTEFAMEQLEAVINRRYVDQSGLIVTTNFDPRALDSPFSPAVRSRFGDRGLCEVVAMDKVPDYRPSRNR